MRQQIPRITPSMKTWLLLMRLGGHTGCHQMANRSLFFRGWQLPLCARCTGIFVGQLVALALCFFVPPTPWMLLLLLPLALDGTTQQLGWRSSTNALRIATGVVGGYGYFSSLLWALFLLVFP